MSCARLGTSVAIDAPSFGPPPIDTSFATRTSACGSTIAAAPAEGPAGRSPPAAAAPAGANFPIAAGIWFGLGLGGFFDGIVLHQLLQWHHMLSSWYPVTSLANLRLNTLWDGIFHSLTYVFIVLGLCSCWGAAGSRSLGGSRRVLPGAVLVGWGIFNLVEGLVDHQLLGIHHVNERVEASQWLAWDIGFLLWGASMLVLGGWLLHQGRRRRRLPALNSRIARG